MNKPGYRNPYALELTLARMFAWTAWLAILVYMGLCVAGVLDFGLVRQIIVGVLIVIAAATASETEKRAVKDFEKFEKAMHGISVVRRS